MSRYRPGTLDDYAVQARRMRRAARVADEAARPLGTQVHQTTAKVADMGDAASEAVRAAESAQAASEEAEASAQAAQSAAAQAAQTAAEAAAEAAEEAVSEAIPVVGQVVLMAEQKPPAHPGTWELDAQWMPDGAEVTYYAYRRAE